MTKVETRAGRIGLCIVLSIGPLSLLTGICCLIASLPTSHWLDYYDNNGTLRAHGGLWHLCDVTDQCWSWEHDPLNTDDEYRTITIAALMISCIAYFLGLVVMFVSSVVSGEQPSLGGISTWILGIIFNCTALVTFSEFQNNPISIHRNSEIADYDYGYSFHLAGICVVTVIVGCGITTLIAFFCGVKPSTGDQDADVAVLAGNEVRSDVYGSESSTEPAGFYQEPAIIV